MDRERYRTTEEAAEYIGYSVRHFRRLVEKHDIPAFGPELNRFATAMLKGGADLAAVSALLGHSNISTTQERYYHLLKGEKERAVSLLPNIAPGQKAGKVVKIK